MVKVPNRVDGLSARSWRRIQKAIFIGATAAIATGAVLIALSQLFVSALLWPIALGVLLAGIALLYVSSSSLLPTSRRIADELEAGYTTMDDGFTWVPGIDDATGEVLRPATTVKPPAKSP